MGLTRNNIAYDFTISPFRLTVVYEDSRIEYVFSSELYRSKFAERAEQNRKSINQSLSNRFGFTVKNDRLCDLKLYTQIEKRGFLIYQDGESFECLKSITLDGQKMIAKR